MTSKVQIARWGDRLRDIAAFGLRYAENIYDQERYSELQKIAFEMLSDATETSAEELTQLWAPVFSRPTPLSVGDAAVIDAQGRILLIQRSDNQKWALPGGALEVGETPAQGVVRETLEETGMPSRPVGLVGVFDSLIHGSISPLHLYVFTYLCEPLAAEPPNPPSHSHEVLAVEWFTEEDLPAEMSPGHAFRIAQSFRVWRGEDGSPFFDGLESVVE